MFSLESMKNGNSGRFETTKESAPGNAPSVNINDRSIVHNKDKN